MRLEMGGLCALAGFLLAGCSSRAEQTTHHIVVTGSRSMAPLVADMARRFQESRSDVTIDVQSVPGSRGVSDARQGLADLGMLGRPLRPDEGGLIGFPLARDGLAMIVHRDNPVQTLTDAQVVGLFTRVNQNWKELGGRDQPIELAGQAEGRGARDAFLTHFGLLPQQGRANSSVSGSDQVVEAVATHPFAFGFASLGPAEKAAQRLPIRLLPLGGVPATLDNVRNGRYPLVRPLQLLSREPPHDAMLAFIDFARSAAVHDLVEKHGFVPLSP